MNFKVEKSDMKGDAGMAHIQTESEWELEMCGKIVDYLAGKIYVDMRFMEPVLNVLVPRATWDCPHLQQTEYICI